MKSTAVLILVLALLALASESVLAQSRSHRRRSHRSSGKSASQLKNDLRSLHDQKERLKKELTATKHQATVVTTDIQAVDDKLDDVQNKLDETNSRLGDSRDEQAKLAVDLQVATQKLEATRILVARRLRHVYVHGQASFISALVGTRSVGDVASRQSLLQMIAKKDHQLFADYQNLQHTVADHKKRQDALVVRIRGLARQQKSQQDDLQATRDEKGEVLRGLKSKQGKIQGLIAQFDSDEREVRAEIAAFARRRLRPGEKPLPAFTGRLGRPVNARITSTFGMRYHPVLHYTRLHAGIDFGVPSGTPVHAAGDGEVIVARYSPSFGNYVVIDHGGGVTTLYAHNTRLIVRVGERVHRGQQISVSGATGLVSGPHVHFEVRVNGRPVNPMGWL